LPFTEFGGSTREVVTNARKYRRDGLSTERSQLCGLDYQPGIDILGLSYQF
jgi:hypothetical protein